jgi:N-acyl-D-aspartate/D-glutamate deacylase
LGGFFQNVTRHGFSAGDIWGVLLPGLAVERATFTATARALISPPKFLAAAGRLAPAPGASHPYCDEMLDVHIVGASIIDGTGSPARTGDIGIRDGRIVAIGRVDEPAIETIDAAGLVACPGFVDVHTHYDAQLLWDPSASPSGQHGVTSIVGGNCSFGLAPLDPTDADYARRLLAKVEGMPIEALERGASGTWGSFGDYLDRLEGAIGVNAGFLVGHSPLRRLVVGPEANERHSTPDEIELLRAELGRTLADGALGLSIDASDFHSDGNGRPVPARGASHDELLSLCELTGQHEGTTLAGIFAGASTGFGDEEAAFIAQLSAVADRPLNWNVLVVDAGEPERIERHMAPSRIAREVGGRVVALTMPVIVPMNMSFGTYCAFNLIPGWPGVLNQPLAARMETLRDPEVRTAMLASCQGDDAGMFKRLTGFADYVIGDTYSAENDGLSGRRVGDIAAERGTEPFDTLLDIALADDLRTILWPSATDDDDAHWNLRVELWKDPDILLGGSDAGAHLDRMCGGSYPTQFLADTLRGRRLMSLERAVQHLTDTPARLFGLRDRGRLAEGAHADLVLFDPATIDAGQAHLVNDLPGGSARLTADAIGVERVLVNGVTTYEGGTWTGALPGTVLRSGRDTDTVHTRSATS